VDVVGKIEALTTRHKAELKDTKRVKKNKANNQIEITSFFKPKTLKL